MTENDFKLEKSPGIILPKTHEIDKIKPRLLATTMPVSILE